MFSFKVFFRLWTQYPCRSAEGIKTKASVPESEQIKFMKWRDRQKINSLVSSCLVFLHDWRISFCVSARKSSEKRDFFLFFFLPFSLAFVYYYNYSEMAIDSAILFCSLNLVASSLRIVLVGAGASKHP